MQGIYSEDKFVYVCRHKGLIVDANILILYLVGLTSVDRIKNHPATSSYSLKDFYAAKGVMDIAKRIIIPSYTVPEVSNRIPLDMKPKKGRTAPSRFLTAAVAFLANEGVEEKHISFKSLLDHKSLQSLGFTDVSIAELSKSGYAVLTNDNQLLGVLRNTNSAPTYSLKELSVIYNHTTNM